VTRTAHWLLLASLSMAAQAQPGAGAPAQRHQQSGPTMSAENMRQLMQMDDARRFGTLMFDQLEWRGADGQQAGAWDAQGWYGGDSDKVWLKTEGVRADSRTTASAELLWDRVVSPWWDAQLGARSDFGTGPSRTWVAFGLQGVAPYMFDTEATLYVGESGRTAARVKMECDVYLTQRLVVQPKAEVNAYGKRDPARALGSGVSDLDLGARVRYELRRELAPYIGVNWSRMFGSTADLARADGRAFHDLQLTLGVRFWL
jgi:copper resistance protein B